MLTLQMIRIMSKIWVQEGLDMRMVIFRCFSTGRGRGQLAVGRAVTRAEGRMGVPFALCPLAYSQHHLCASPETSKGQDDFIISCGTA